METWFPLRLKRRQWIGVAKVSRDIFVILKIFYEEAEEIGGWAKKIPLHKCLHSPCIWFQLQKEVFGL